MDEKIITGKMLKQRGWPEGKVIGLAKVAGDKLRADGIARETALDKLDGVLAAPGEFLADAVLGDLAREVVRRQAVETDKIESALREAPLPFPIWGKDGIDEGAITQMNNSMSLPITAAGALMPDAHIGYGLPIGGVLATTEAVIPYAVGVDIACRMRLSIYDVSPHVLGQYKSKLEKALLTQTQFGMGSAWPKGERPDHEVLEDPAWKATKLLKGLQFKAMEQLGSSGTGNHFVEWGELELPEAEFGLKAGKYLALLSHSGSRAVGAKIANEYSKIAMNLHPTLEKSVRHLAWLPIKSEPGEEYWLSMELAGRFASANHAIIHKLVAKAAGFKEVASVENHHNFAWKETLEDGTPVFVHRKGATPAGKGVLGVIPGSMGDPGFVVRGKGVGSSINSASHGAGRKMGRKAAINALTNLMRDRYLQERGVTLLGGGLDEAPQAYKDIHSVLAAQEALVEVVAKFTPRIVRMADEPGDV